MNCSENDQFGLSTLFIIALCPKQHYLQRGIIARQYISVINKVVFFLECSYQNL